MSRAALPFTLAVLLSAAYPATAAAGDTSLSTLVRALSYDEGLSKRLTEEPLRVIAIGVPCTRWPTGARIAGHEARCESGAGRPGLVAEAAVRKAIILLGEVDAAQGESIVVQSKDALVPVVAVGEAHASPDVLLSVDGTRLFVGEQAVKRLGAKFPTSVLRLATIVTGAVEDTEPTVRERFAAGTYPDEALNAGVEGPVLLRITVDEAGRVTDAVVLRGLGFGLDEEAVRRIKRFTFNPARRGGKPVPASIDYTIRFTIQD